MTAVVANQLRISETLALPLDTVTEPVGVFGNRGAGKTNTAVVFVEELLDVGQQAAIIDPTDVWWGLKSSKDGTKAGYPVVVLGGKHQDAPLGADDGKTVADFVVDEGATVVLSTRHFESHNDGIRFVTAFLRRMYYRKGQQDAPSPLTVIADEAHLWFPQMTRGGLAPDCLGAGQQIVRQGRSTGLGMWIIDQRTASVNKDLIDLVEVLVAHRITGPKNRAALKDWIEQNADDAQRKDFLATLASQPDGTAWVWSPSRLALFKQVKIRERRTYDSSRTPKVGERILAPTKLAAIDIPALTAKLAATIERAKADDPKELRKELAARDREISQLKKSSAAPAVDLRATERAASTALRESNGKIARLQKALEAAMKFIINISAANFDVVGVDKAQLERAMTAAVEQAASIVDQRLGARSKQLEDLSKNAQRLVAQLQAAIGDEEVVVAVGVSKAEPFTLTSTPERTPVAASRPHLPPTQRSHTPHRSPSDAKIEGTKIGGTPQRMLNALRFLESVGTSPASRKAIAGLVGVSWDTGTFRTYLSELRSAGFIADGADLTVALTDEGRAQASDDDIPRSVEALHAVWLSKLGGTPAKMLRLLLEAYPDAVERADLGAACGIDATTGTFRTYLSVLRSPGLIVDASKTSVRAADALYPEGL